MSRLIVILLVVLLLFGGILYFLSSSADEVPQTRIESDVTRWQTGYDTPAFRAGRYVKETFRNGTPVGMNGLAFNTRRAVFADIRVREALASLFDFEWVNKNFFFGLQKRTASYFEGSDLSSVGRPADVLRKPRRQ